MLALLHRHFTRHPALTTIWPIAIIIIGLLGFLDSGYLTYKHYAHEILPCPIVESVNTCQVVATSIYSNILGIPLALIGLGFYTVIILIGLLALKEKYQFMLNFVPLLSVLSWLFSVRLTYLQFFVINSVCYYCIFSAFLATILVIMGIMIIKKID
ncbi:MAG: vitamin K epoxide reductase family protein [Candidatus Magasanikbacteria bacterium]